MAITEVPAPSRDGGREWGSVSLLADPAFLLPLLPPHTHSQVWDGVAEVHMALNNQATGLLVGAQRGDYTGRCWGKRGRG